MKKLIIADIASLRKGNQGFGHYTKVAQMYCNMFDNRILVRAAGGPVYELTLKSEKFMRLPHDIDADNLTSKMDIIKSKLKSLNNGRVLFKNASNSIIVCQPYSFMIWMVSILFFAKGKDIYLIEYKKELRNLVNKILFKVVKNRIKGIICPNDMVGKSYGLPYITMPDYVYCDADTTMVKNSSDEEYDIGIVGIMSNGKDIEDIVSTYSNTKIKVLIAGYFEDKERVNYLQKNKGENIIIIDKYLTEEEYEAFFSKVKYVALPYKDYYRGASSGVVFDIIFHHKPVLTKKFPNFRFVEQYHIGALYEESISELSISSLTETEYMIFTKNIDEYLNKNQESIVRLENYFNAGN